MAQDSKEPVELAQLLAGATRKQYLGDFDDHRMELYKLYVESTERISDRRQSANAFFLSANTLILGAEGVLFDLGQEVHLVQLLIGVVGIGLCYFWYRLISSYRVMNEAKFEIVNWIERELPLAIYDAEWKLLKGGKNRAVYERFTDLEKQVPVVIMVLHVAMIAFALWQTVPGSDTVLL